MSFRGLYFYPAQTVPDAQAFPVAENQDIKPGEPVYLDSGQLKKAANAQEFLAGIASTGETTGAGEVGEAHVWLASDRNSFYAFSKGDNINANVIGITCDLDLDGTVFSVDTGATAQDTFLVLGAHPRSAFAQANDPTLLEVKIVKRQV